jgi:hypothetical protein
MRRIRPPAPAAGCDSVQRLRRRARRYHGIRSTGGDGRRPLVPTPANRAQDAAIEADIAASAPLRPMVAGQGSPQDRRKSPCRPAAKAHRPRFRRATAQARASAPAGCREQEEPAVRERADLAGAPGFEPGNGGIKIRCLTSWLRPNRRLAIGRGRRRARRPGRISAKPRAEQSRGARASARAGGSNRPSPRQAACSPSFRYQA